MKFHFIGGLDCPDWILAQIAEFSKLSPELFLTWCNMVADKLRFSRTEWTEQNLEKLKGSSEIDIRTLKSMVAALSFIVEKSVKSQCSAQDLEKEMLQLGLSDEHCKHLNDVYSAERLGLFKILSKDFPRAPSFSVLKSTVETSNSGAELVKLHIRTSTGQSLSVSMNEQKLNALKAGIGEALNSLEPYMK